MSDEKYWDDPIENVSDAKSKSEPRKKIKLLGVLIAASAVFLNTTLAGNINLGSGRVEFGQGILMSTVCDSEIKVTPYVSFVNSSGVGSFYFSGFRFTDVDAAKCSGVTFTLKAYDSATADALTLFGSNKSVSVIDSGTAFISGANQSGFTISDTATSGTFTGSFTTPLALASAVYRITLESSGNGQSQISSVTVSAFTFTAIAAGWTDTCGIISSGSVYCWGRNGYGQLGNGSTSGNSYVPVQVLGISDATQIGLGNSYACALVSNGAIKCWGSQGNGALGNGSGVDSNLPVVVSGISSAVSIGIGNGVNCAALANGNLNCWGYNGSGQVGNGTTGTNVSTPVQVSGISTGTQAIGGQNSSCGLLSTGGVKCWGAGARGDLGNGVSYSGNNGSSTPVDVSGITTATQIAKGDDFGCALLSNGNVNCWGFNSSGQLGDGTTTNRNSPVSVSGISNATGVSARTANACAVISGGTIKCWGWYGQGMLGTNTNTDSPTPVAIAGISNAISVSVGNSHTCAIISGGQVKCWGDNSYGQFGNGSTIPSASPS